jgi:hypothetical protein
MVHRKIKEPLRAPLPLDFVSWFVSQPCHPCRYFTVCRDITRSQVKASKHAEDPHEP